MIYLAGFLGLALGFIAGQIVLAHLLRDRSRSEIIELMKDRGAKFRYGTLNWLLAVLGCLLAVFIYREYVLAAG